MKEGWIVGLRLVGPFVSQTSDFYFLLVCVFLSSFLDKLDCHSSAADLLHQQQLHIVSEINVMPM